MAELDARIAAVTETERRLADRLATLKDGAPGQAGRDGKDGVAGARGEKGETGERGPEGAQGAAGRDGANGRDGADGAAGLRGEKGETGERGPEGAQGAAGKDGVNGRDGVDGAAGARGEKGEPGERGPDGQQGAAGRDGVEGAAGRDGKDGIDGKDGAPGRIDAAAEWSDRVYYEGAVVTHGGGLWQAAKDTGREPPHGDWRCLARAGRDGADARPFTVRGTYDQGLTYQALDVVALGGAAFVARKDGAGPCPGPDWQMIAAQGKAGKPGERGAAGTRGEAGPPGPAIAGAEISDQGLLTLRNADGTTVECDLYPVLAKL